MHLSHLITQCQLSTHVLSAYTHAYACTHTLGCLHIISFMHISLQITKRWELFENSLPKTEAQPKSNSRAISKAWCHMPVIPAFGSWKKGESEIWVIFNYRVSVRPTWATRDCLKTPRIEVTVGNDKHTHFTVRSSCSMHTIEQWHHLKEVRRVKGMSQRGRFYLCKH